MKKLTCHCKKIELDVNLPDEPNILLRCNCSICVRKGAIMAMVGPNDLKIIKGQEFLKTYTFHTNKAKHYFCSNCGIYTHHQPRRNPESFGVNLGCVDFFQSKYLKEIKLIDGKNHPMDKK